MKYVIGWFERPPVLLGGAISRNLRGSTFDAKHAIAAPVQRVVMPCVGKGVTYVRQPNNQ